MKILKTVLGFLVAAAFVAINVLYIKLGWQVTIYGISKFLDATVKTVFAIVYGVTASKIFTLIFTHINLKSQRGQTIFNLLKSMIKYIVAIVVFVVILSYFIEDTTSLFTGISVLTLVIGLGMQSLISDIVAGIFIVFESDYQVGDIVVLDGWRGVVTEIGLRTTKIKDALGNIQIVNNSQISKIINNSKDVSTAICDFGTEYGESLERIENVLKDNLDNVRAKIPAIVDGPFYKGVQSLADSAVVIRLVANCKEEDKYQVQRDLNREIKLVFDKCGVAFPFPQVTVSQFEKNTSFVSERQKETANNFANEQKTLSSKIEENEENG